MTVEASCVFWHSATVSGLKTSPTYD